MPLNNGLVYLKRWLASKVFERFVSFIFCARVIPPPYQIRVLALEKVRDDTLMGLAFERKDVVSLKKIVACLNDAGPLEGTEVHTVKL